MASLRDAQRFPTARQPRRLRKRSWPKPRQPEGQQRLRTRDSPNANEGPEADLSLIRVDGQCQRTEAG